MLSRERTDLLRRWFFLPVLLFLTGSAPVMGAGEVILHLTGGDRISGIILTEEAGTVVVSNRWNSALRIPVSEIASREAPSLA